MRTYVVINRHIIKANKKLPENQRAAPIRVTRGKYGKPEYYYNYDIDDAAKLVYDPENPMPCGATVWLEIDD